MTVGQGQSTPPGRHARLVTVGRRLAVAAAAAVALPSCTASSANQPGAGSRMVQVVAAENFWGSIAAQLGGSRVQVRSVVTDPNADPHEYESSTGDARAFAEADYVILNGAGYDDWGEKLLSANPSGRRRLLTVATLLHKREGDNPHFWYSPVYVEAVADRISADLGKIDPAETSYFRAQRSKFEAALGPYHQKINAIAAYFGRKPVSSTESIFVYMSSALKLDLVSPVPFMKAVAEGNDPPASAVAAFQSQLSTRQVALLVYNSQTVTAVTTNIKQIAATHGIPVVGISETLQPPGTTFQAWQTAQLSKIASALEQASGR